MTFTLSRLRRSAIYIAIAGASIYTANALAQDSPADTPVPIIEVIGTTLLPGLGSPIQDVPANVQVVTSKNIDKQRQNTIIDYLVPL